MTPTLAELDAELNPAREDAGYSPEQVRVYLASEITGGDRPQASWFPPGDVLVVDEMFPDPGQLADANDPAHINLHRIVMPRNPPDVARFAALLRHEFEHARQFDALGMQIFDLQTFLEREVLSRRAGGLPQSSGLINEIPTEVDCNAAASVYVAGRFSAEELADLRASNGYRLAGSHVGPEPFDRLPARMVACAFIHRGCVKAYADEQGKEPADVLDALYPGTGEIWERLEAGVG